ncbi:hypothetical protein [Bradyrhizobium diazoefficiens]|uniref:Uncharacterized protein n=1 Tax=Bradyrhizobium diazoefficiens TaxID=1355477 RepID=A0A809XJ04_9BRAD|nr:hypothetical protein [Bradyrhizobium diazoefficiens]WLA74784.1 hypothetical protein QIH77_06200 [Bradyrhizobium diazoefficiens]BCE25978.1 hypothetical protein XF1B_86590 [Bradyrhizobium diazoefficiens]BCE52235.1 hypothetical protein XF4B_85840 [Bradyrhizobium diazoefficiens]BCE95728.1 hypothetical protein XF10B_85260 [Bradyrhizobium diazoefficiens]BCF30678.1 hypothetical protein XF14B_86300 [Bradyrhizobium diazoefficiens]
MASPPDYAAFVAQAESAVKGLKDPELKRIAFQKVLDDLIGASDRPFEGASSRSSGAKKPAKAAKAAKSSKSKSATRGGPRAYIRELVEDAFFKKPKTLSDVKVELENRGHHIAITSLSGPLQQLCKLRELRRKRTEEPGAKKTYVYSNW